MPSLIVGPVPLLLTTKSTRVCASNSAAARPIRCDRSEYAPRSSLTIACLVIGMYSTEGSEFVALLCLGQGTRLEFAVFVHWQKIRRFAQLQTVFGPEVLRRRLFREHLHSRRRDFVGGTQRTPDRIAQDQGKIARV